MKRNFDSILVLIMQDWLIILAVLEAVSGKSRASSRLFWQIIWAVMQLYPICRQLNKITYPSARLESQRQDISYLNSPAAFEKIRHREASKLVRKMQERLYRLALLLPVFGVLGTWTSDQCSLSSLLVLGLTYLTINYILQLRYHYPSIPAPAPGAAVVTILKDYVCPLVKSDLPDGPLRSRILALADTVGLRDANLVITKYPQGTLYQVVTPKRKLLGGRSAQLFVSNANAYTDGDQIIGKDLTEAEIEAMLAQKLGQYYKSQSKDFQFPSDWATVVFLVSQQLLSKFLCLTPDWAFFLNYQLSHAYYLQFRINNINAITGDRFAVQNGYGEALRSALVKISGNQLEYPEEDALFSSWFGQPNPSLMKRLEFIGKVTEEMRNKEGGALVAVN